MTLPHQVFAVSAAVLMLLVLVSCSSKENKLLLGPSQALGNVLAEETVSAAGTKKQIILIQPQWAANSTAGESFTSALKKQGLTVAFTISADMGDPMGRSPIGLKSADFFIAIEKSANCGAIVSLAGAPILNAQEIARLNSEHAPVLVVATSSLGNVLGVPADQTYLSGLLNAKVIQLAIVDGKSEPDQQLPGKMDAAQKLFFQHYSILRNHD